MNKPVASFPDTPAPPVTDHVSTNTPEEVLLRVFAGLRDELVSTLWYLLGNQEDAKDIAQETFLRCWRASASLAEVRDMRAWIFRVSLNCARDLQRTAWRRRVRPLLGEEDMLIDEGPGPDQALEDQETVLRVRLAMHDLREEEKEVFLLRQNGELTYEEIAELYNRPLGTVKTQMRSALQKLRKVLT